MAISHSTTLKFDHLNNNCVFSFVAPSGLTSPSNEMSRIPSGAWLDEIVDENCLKGDLETTRAFMLLNCRVLVNVRAF